MYNFWFSEIPFFGKYVIILEKLCADLPVRSCPAVNRNQEFHPKHATFANLKSFTFLVVVFLAFQPALINLCRSPLAKGLYKLRLQPHVLQQELW